MPTDPPVTKASALDSAAFRRLVLRQAQDQKSFGKFMDKDDSVDHRTDAGRLGDSDKFLSDYLNSYPDGSALFIDVGPGLGNPDAKMQGITSRETMKALGKKARVVAVDIDEARPKYKRADMDVEFVPPDFTPRAADIAQKRGFKGDTWVVRAANSIDLLMTPEQMNEHFNQLAKQADGKEVVYIFNKHILRKDAKGDKFFLVGEINNRGYAHNNKPWKNKSDKTPSYTLEPSGASSVETSSDFRSVVPAEPVVDLDVNGRPGAAQRIRAGNRELSVPVVPAEPVVDLDVNGRPGAAQRIRAGNRELSVPESAMKQELTPAQFAQQLGGRVTEVAPSGSPAGPSPEEFAKSLGGSVIAEAASPTAIDNGIIHSNTGWDQFWRGMYAAIPDVTGMIGGAVGGTFGGAAGAIGGGATIPVVGAVPGAVTGALLGGSAGAGAGGIVGRGIQYGIDELFDRPQELRNPLGAGDVANQQMTWEGAGRVFSRFLSKYSLRGSMTPETPGAAERLATDAKYDMGLSPAEISGTPTAAGIEYLARRGVSGIARQKTAQRRTDEAAKKAVDSVLGTIGAPGTETGIGETIASTVKDAGARGTRRLEGTVASNLAPSTGLSAAGETAEAGVQAGRTAFSRQGEIFDQIKKDSPPIDMTPLHKQALAIFKDQIMPAMLANPSLGANNKAWKEVAAMYRKIAIKGGGEVVELPPSFKNMLANVALDKTTYGPLRVISMALSTPREMPFESAIKLRGLLRDAGKGSELLAGSEAKGLATFLESGSRTSEWGGLRAMLNEASPLYEAAAAAYNPNRKLFDKAGFIASITSSNPESVLKSLTNTEGRYNATRIRQINRVLTGITKEHGTPEEVAIGTKAWDTLRAEWFRREVMQDNVFGLAERMKKIDADVMQAWFPDMAGNAVKRQADNTAKAFQNTLIGQIAQADPSKIVSMIGSSPSHVREFMDGIKALPGPVKKDQIIDQARRAWVESDLVADPTKISEKLQKTDPELLKAWFQTPDQQNALEELRRIGNAMSTRRPVSAGFGTYETAAAATVGGFLLTGNLPAALTIIVGHEALPAFVSHAMYNPRVRKFLFEAATPNATVTSKTAALLHASREFAKSLRPQDQQEPQQ